MLEIKNLSVEREGKKILEKINLNLEKGKIYVLMGRNGSGKSTLANAIMGNPKYHVTEGKIYFKNKDIIPMPVSERAKIGIFMSFQAPNEVPGVPTSAFLRQAYNSVAEKKVSFFEFQKLVEKESKSLNMKKEFLSRHINDGLSGGEKKKSEILQAIVLKPRFAIFDEIDSGLDADSMKAVSRQIKKLAGKDTTILMITHYKKILDYLKPDAVFVMDKGKIILHGGKDLIDKIDRKGYRWIKRH